MNHLKIGVRLESLGPTLRQAIPEVQRLGVRGVQAEHNLKVTVRDVKGGSSET